MPSIAAVILNYNGRDFLLKFLPLLIKHSPESSIYVADNGSSDDSMEILKKFPEVHLISLNRNYGFTGGYNRALSQIVSDYYILINSDIEVTSGWIPPLLSFLETHPDYVAVQPKIRDYSNKSHFEYAGAAGGYLDSLGYPYCRGRIFNSIEEDKGQYNDPTEVFWTTGACMMIRSLAFHQINGFDDAFFAHMEEIDLCWRLKSQEMKSAYIPQSTVYHVGGGTLNKTSSFKTYLNIRNGIFLLIKNLPRKKLIIILPIRILFDWAASIMLWKQNSASHALAVFRAHVHALKKSLPYLKINKRSSPLMPHQKAFILPIRHYIQGKRTFSEVNSTK